MKMGVYQGSKFSTYLFAMVRNELTKEVREMVPWCMMFAVDIILIVVKYTGVRR